MRPDLWPSCLAALVDDDRDKDFEEQLIIKVVPREMPDPLGTSARRVVNYPTGRPRIRAHERATFVEVGKRLAALQGIEFAGDYDAARDDEAQPYYVPDDTLLSEVAVRL